MREKRFQNDVEVAVLYTTGTAVCLAAAQWRRGSPAATRPRRRSAGPAGIIPRFVANRLKANLANCLADREPHRYPPINNSD